MKKTLQDFIVTQRNPQDVVVFGQCVHLQWEGWVLWNDLALPRRARPYILPVPGVYEVKYAHANDFDGERLIIGVSNTSLHARIEAMVTPNGEHNEGEKLREEEAKKGTFDTIWVSWAPTPKAKEVEVCLFRRYLLLHHWDFPMYCNDLPYISGLRCC